MTRELDRSKKEMGRDRKRMPLRTWFFLIPIQLMGLSVLVQSLLQGQQEADATWLFLLLLTGLTGFVLLRLSPAGKRGGSVAVTPGDFFILAALTLLGPAAAVLMGAFEGLVSSWKAGVKSFVKLLFNVSQLVLSAKMSGLLFIWLYPARVVSGEMEAGKAAGLLGTLLLCAVVYFLVNALLLATAVALTSQRSVTDVFRSGLLWGLPTICINAGLVTAVAALMGPINLLLAVVILPLILIIYGVRRIQGMTGTITDGTGFFDLSFIGENLPSKARGYLLAIIVVSLPLYLFCLHRTFTAENSNWIYLAGLSVVASWFPVRLFSMRDKLWLSLGDVFVFVAIFQFGPEVAVVIASLEAIAFNLKRRPKNAYRWLFNTGQLVIVAFLVGTLFRLLHSAAGPRHLGEVGAGNLAIALSAPMLCGFVYYLATLGLTGLAVALSTHQPVRELLLKNFRWCYPSVLGALVGAFGYLFFHGFGLLA